MGRIDHLGERLVPSSIILRMSKETPKDDPREQSDWPNKRQTEKPWKGNPEKDQLRPDRPAPDLEKWRDSGTH
jgi:hypothetical protein